jgi:hypothetical protein
VLMNFHRNCILFILMSFICINQAKILEASDFPGWVHTEKFRAYWSPPFELIEPSSQAGFNVMIQRWETAVDLGEIETETTPNVEGYTFKQAQDELQRASRLCKKLNIRYFPCLNVGAIEPVVRPGFKNNLRRHHMGKLPCPMDEIYWDRVIVRRFERIINLLAGPNYQLDGLIIDPEMYFFGGAFLQQPCYCQWCAGEFAKSCSEAEELVSIDDASVREKWLTEHRLSKKYNDWQYGKSRQMVKKLEKMAHANRPDLILGFLIYEKNPCFDAMAEGLYTEGMPIMIGTEMQTYSGAYDDSYLAYEKTLAQQVPVPFINCPGIWINGNSAGQAPARLLDVIEGNMYHRTIRADGYFVYASDRWGGNGEKAKPFTKAFKKINDEVNKYLKSDGNYKSPLKPRPLPVDPPGNMQQVLTDAQNWQRLTNSGKNEIPIQKLPHLRESEGQTHMVIFKAKKGDPIKISMYTAQLGNYIDKGSVAIFNPGAEVIGNVLCEYNKSVSYKMTAPETGAYSLVATANSNAYAVDITGAAWVIVAKTMKLNRVGGKFYFYVPEGIKTLNATFGIGSELADYNLYDDQGKIIYSKKDVKDSDVVEFSTEGKSGIWTIEINNIMDDTEFRLTGIDRYAVNPSYVMIN